MSRGRNRSLVDKRDEKLLLRYYYWRNVHRLRDDAILQILSEREFFIAPARIWRIICEKDDGSYAGLFPAKPAPPPRHIRTPTQLALFEGE